MALLFGFLTQTLLANQVATGLALTMFGLGLAALWGQAYSGKTAGKFPKLEIPVLSDLPVGSGGASETCFDGLGTSLVDSTPLAPGDGFWYLARGVNNCGGGGYGFQNPPVPRTSATCP